MMQLIQQCLMGSKFHPGWSAVILFYIFSVSSVHPTASTSHMHDGEKPGVIKEPILVNRVEEKLQKHKTVQKYTSNLNAFDNFAVTHSSIPNIFVTQSASTVNNFNAKEQTTVKNIYFDTPGHTTLTSLSFPYGLKDNDGGGSEPKRQKQQLQSNSHKNEQHYLLSGKQNNNHMSGQTVTYNDNKRQNKEVYQIVHKIKLREQGIDSNKNQLDGTNLENIKAMTKNKDASGNLLSLFSLPSFNRTFAPSRSQPSSTSMTSTLQHTHHHEKGYGGDKVPLAERDQTR